LRDDVGSHLPPARRHLHVGQPEDHRTVGVLDLAGGRTKFDPGIGPARSGSEATFDAHSPESPIASADCPDPAPPQRVGLIRTSFISQSHSGAPSFPFFSRLPGGVPSISGVDWSPSSPNM